MNIINKIIEKADKKIVQVLDLFFDSRSSGQTPCIKNSFLKDSEIDTSDLDEKTLEYLCDMYTSHKFDLLGSGWVRNTYYMKAGGLNGFRYKNHVVAKDLKCMLKSVHRRRTAEIIALIDSEYVNIDWQRDFKSGYRWCESEWYKCKRSLPPGADLKVPWELSRCQHLPQLAVFALRKPERQRALITEFKNQTLDFIAFNPPRFGVNWQCTMDAAIRAANWLVAYDIFAQMDSTGILDKKFQNIFFQSIYDHGKHIISNLEISPGGNRNHYLADIAGLIFIAVYLDKTDETVKWLTFGISELKKEVLSQFYSDGVNVEASTCYHRLSAEMVMYTTALLSGACIDNSFSQEYISRIINMLKFAEDITKPSGEMPQIGDNDSGRFLKFTPVGGFMTLSEAVAKYNNLQNGPERGDIFWDENVLNHQSLIAVGSTLFGNIQENVPGYKLEISVINSLCGQNVFAKQNVQERVVKYQEIDVTANMSHSHEKVFLAQESKSGTLQDGLKRYFYPDGGIFLLKSKRLFLLIRAGKIGPNGVGGHAHNDNLSFELAIDGCDIVVDPGTYLYTPIPDLRNKFRSSKVHNTIWLENLEQNNVLDNKYRLPPLVEKNQCECISFEEGDYVFSLKMGHATFLRKFEVHKDSLKIIDKGSRPFKSNFNCHDLYSNGYGKLLN